MKRLLVAAVALTALGGCSEPQPAEAGADATVAEVAMAETAAPARAVSLPELFDCLRKSGGALVAAHRGGPAAGYPENALETLKHGFNQGVRVFEIDVATSRDGVLFLHHDDKFGRTARGDGYVSDTEWADVSRLSLRDNDGKTTDFHPPKLSEVLIWAKLSGAIVELDRKRTTGFRSILEEVKAAGAEANVVIVTYSDEEAAEVARLDPQMMMTATARGGRDIATLEGLGVDRTRVVAWTGTDEPDPPAFERLVKEGVEPAFGTLGRKGERLDDQYWEDGDGSEYQRLIDDGVVLIATDEPYRVAEWLDADDAGWAACAVVK